MKIAIHAADLDSSRIDGTRVYIKELLDWWGELDSANQFLIYHKSEFNPELKPKNFPNYKIKKLKPLPYWTQTRFAFSVYKEAPEVLFMPMHNMPFFHNRKTKTVATIHDLAFKSFPQYFPKKDLRRLNLLTKLAIEKSDRLIAVSHSTKNDIINFYPEVKQSKIKVIYHGFDRSLFHPKENNQEEDIINDQQVLKKFRLQSERYILYVGAIQPRKNLPTLIEAFNQYKKKSYADKDLKLVIVGAKAWMWEKTIKKAKKSPFKNSMLLTGKVKFSDLGSLYRHALVFVFPSFYEGFGIPILEAFASGVPVITADNSSLKEVGGRAAVYFQAQNSKELAERLEEMILDQNLRESMAKKGYEQVNQFSWQKCAKRTLYYLVNG